MPLDLSRLSKGASDFLRAMLPYLVQQKFQKQMLDYQTQAWLQKSLQEYGAYGDIQERLQKQSALNAIFGDISDVLKTGVKEAPFPEVEFVRRGRAIGLPMGEVEAPPPEEYQAGLQQYAEVARPLIYARLNKVQPSEEEVSKALQVFGRDAVYMMIGDFADDVIKRAEQDLRTKEITVQEKRLPISKMEAETARRRVEIEEVGGQTAKEIQDEIKKLQNDRDTQALKYTGVGAPWGVMFGKQERAIAAKISKIDTRLRELEQQTGQQILPGQTEYGIFEKMARENAAAGKEINWEEALVLGFDIYWLMKLKAELEKR